MKKTYTAKSETETMDIAADFAKTLTGNATILIKGPLGAGKTVFVRGLAQAMGVSKRVTSPTFTLMNLYPVKKKSIKQIAHLDAYRVSGRDLLDIGLQEYIERPDTIVVIEWAQKVKDFIHGLANVIEVSIEPVDDKKRIISIK